MRCEVSGEVRGRSEASLSGPTCSCGSSERVRPPRRRCLERMNGTCTIAPQGRCGLAASGSCPNSDTSHDDCTCRAEWNKGRIYIPYTRDYIITFRSNLRKGGGKLYHREQKSEHTGMGLMLKGAGGYIRNNRGSPQRSSNRDLKSLRNHKRTEIKCGPNREI